MQPTIGNQSNQDCLTSNLEKKIQTLSSLDCTFVIVCERSLEQRESK